jgi:hypothetical protein
MFDVPGFGSDAHVPKGSGPVFLFGRLLLFRTIACRDSAATAVHALRSAGYLHWLVAQVAHRRRARTEWESKEA